MAYDASAEKREILAEIAKNSRGDLIRVTKIINTSTKAEWVDVRWMYTDANDEVMPTKKGIRFNTELTKEIVLELLMTMTAQEINDVFVEIDGREEIDDDEEREDEDEDEVNEGP